MRFGALAALLVLWVPLAARAQVAQRTVGTSWRDGALRVSVSAGDLSNADVERKLRSGLPQTLVLRALVYPEGGGAPIAATARTCRVVFDLWEDVFRVQRSGDGPDRTESVARLPDVLDRCLSLRDAPVGDAAALGPHRGTRVYVAVLAELNPVSPETVLRIRAWLAQPGGGRVESEAFFGSFVSLFVNRRIGSAERSVAFRSQAFVVPP